MHWLSVCCEVTTSSIAGATGSGKTTLVSVLADFVPADDRILVIEDTAELHIRKPHVVSAESQTDTHRNSVTFDDLLKARPSASSRPDHRRRGAWTGGANLTRRDEHGTSRNAGNHPRQQRGGGHSPAGESGDARQRQRRPSCRRSRNRALSRPHRIHLTAKRDTGH